MRNIKKLITKNHINYLKSSSDTKFKFIKNQKKFKNSHNMGLLTILKQMKEKEKEIRLLILGLDNAGKTTIVKKFNGEDIEQIAPTLGFNIKTLEYE